MPEIDRKGLICDQATATVTGIDFVRVADPNDQRRLHVFFIVDPDALDVDPFDITAAPPAGFARIDAVESSDGAIPVAALSWDRLPDAHGNLRTVLVVDVAEPGDFRLYRLTLRDPHVPSRIDRFFNDEIFSFKQGCPTAFDCAPRHGCPVEPPVDWPIDYLARDFESFRIALMDFAAQRYPDWQERIPADVGSMVAELMAALGDEFSYVQDRYSREGYLETLTQRRSLAAFAGLVDYQLDEGLSASTILRLTVDTGGVEVPAGLRAWADPEGMPAMAFEVGTGLRSYRDLPAEGLERATYWLHALWNDMPAHVPDPAVPCLEVGARALWVVGEPLVAATLPGTPDPSAVARFWIGRKLLIETRPVARDAPARRVVVEVDAPVEVVTDPLITDAGGNPITATRIHWRAEDALPFALDLTSTFVSANLVPATAGLTVRDHVAIDSPPAPPHQDLPVTVERAGPFDPDNRSRAILHRRSLPLTDTSGLGWLFAENPPPLGAFPIPEALVEEVQPGAGPVDGFPAGDLWRFQREILLADEQDRVFTVEPGVWRDVISFDRLGERIVHQDYAADGGATVRFGDGTFGRRPADGTVFRITYRTGPGRLANLPADSITLLAAPPGAPPGAAAPTEAALVAVGNPLPVTGGRDPEDMELARRIIPEAFRALTWRAVLDADYREIAERLPWVQRAGAVTRWTGSWLTTFVTPDPLGSATLSEPRRIELEALMDRVRQAGREVHLSDPVFLDVDLDISICIEPGAYSGQVQERVTRALTGPARYGEPLPFFHPDRWSFGDPLYRAELEAAIAAVPGVLAVDEFRLRRRGQAEFSPFTDAVLVVGTDRILRLANDPRLPDQGSLAIRLRAIAPA